MNYLSVFLLAILAIGVFSSGMEVQSKVESGPGTTTKLRVETRRTVTTTHPRERRQWGYGGMGYGMGYGMGGYGMRPWGMRRFGYGMGYPMWG